jgi:hypothetical protein
MPALDTTQPTLADLAKRLTPEGNIETMIVEMLEQEEEMLEDMVWVPGNLTTGHRTTVRTGIPEPTWRRMYDGVQPTKSTTAQITDNCGMLEDYAQVDKALADLNGNTQAFRLSEDKAHIQGFAHKVAKYLFYGNETTEPAAFTGLAPRFNSLSAESGQNIINASGNSARTSVWLINWADDKVHGIVPKNSRVGLQVTDKGQQTVTKSDGSMFEAYRTHYRWDVGLTVRDWRFVVRIANIDSSALVKDAATGADLVDLMTQAVERIKHLKGGRPAFYCNRKVRSFLRRQIKNAKNMNLTLDTVAGKQVVAFDGVPVRMTDSLTLAETAVS